MDNLLTIVRHWHCDEFLGITLCFNSIFFLAFFLLDGLAIVEIIRSRRSDGDKLLWVLLILFFQVFGLIAYFFFSDRKRYQRSTWYRNIA
ncbi:unnamed protein product [Rhizophagus irregularis]|nr:unnamed protein product [Rhizophagus irregularis]CAB4423579.1 unnamed protein product [Rhizophagus irregularis]CAB4423865.1 unnamed protein product [Rhizophagus irregularis]CAB5379371.1 unnamed protein product [Rhizophagus irregularis]